MSTTPVPVSSAQLYAVFVPKGTGSPAGEVFKSLREASSFATSPLPKRYGARFKRFHRMEEANKYARDGDEDDLSVKAPDGSSGIKARPNSEPVVPYPSVSRPQLNEVKRSIEKSNNDLFVKLAEENPRVLINTSADTPTIIAEGCRYNALHLAAKIGNVFVTQYVLELVQDHAKLSKIYGTPDVAIRSKVLLENFLTTPDKGENSTPLHFASKFGHAEIVAILANFSVCKLTTRNKFELSPADVVCERFSGEYKRERCASIRRFLGAHYIALYRSSDCSSFPILASPMYRYPPPVMNPAEVNIPNVGDSSSKRITVTPSRITPLMSRLNMSNVGPSNCLKTYNRSAVAGPFESLEEANKFFSKWNSTGRNIKLSDANNGHEKVGRDLAEQDEVMFAEYSTTLGRLVTTNDPSEEKFYDVEEAEDPPEDDAEESDDQPGDLSLLCLQLNGLHIVGSPSPTDESEDDDETVFITPPGSPTRSS